jgi:hypothetical protein
MAKEQFCRRSRQPAFIYIFTCYETGRLSSIYIGRKPDGTISTKSMQAFQWTQSILEPEIQPFYTPLFSLHTIRPDNSTSPARSSGSTRALSSCSAVRDTA